MNKLEQFFISAIIAALPAIACYYLIDESYSWMFGFIEQIIASIIVGIIAFVLMALYYRKENREEMRKAEIRKAKREERKKKAEEKNNITETFVVKERTATKGAEILLSVDDINKSKSRRSNNSKSSKKPIDTEKSNPFDWKFDTNSKTLTITGHGRMPENWCPWQTLKYSKLIIGDEIKSISSYAFDDKRLGSDAIHFGNSVEEIGEHAFSIHPVYSNIILDNTSDYSDERIHCEARKFILPDSIKIIHSRAFKFSMRCYLVLGKNVEHIGSNLIGSESMSVAFTSEEPPILESGALNHVSDIYVPVGCWRKYVDAPSWKGVNPNKIHEREIESMKCSPLEERILKEKEKEKEREEEEYMAEYEATLRKKMANSNIEQINEKVNAKKEAKFAEEVATSNKKDIISFDWDYDQNTKMLTIIGPGNMPKDWRPWSGLRVHSIIIKDGVLSVCPCAFKDLYGDDLMIDFGGTLISIGEKAFAGQQIPGISVFPASLTSIGENAFTVPCGTFCFKSENPPSLDINSLIHANEIVVPIGSLKKFLSSSQDWKYLASRTKEKDVLLMHSSLELEAMEKEKKRKEEAERKAEEERQKAEEEKRRREEEKRRKAEEERQKAEEEKRRREEEKRRKAEEERQKAEVEEHQKAEESFDWDYDQNTKMLTIIGPGNMPKDWRPWSGLRVHSIIIKDGVLSVCPCAFKDLYGDDLMIDFGGTLISIGEKAFADQRIPGISVFPATLTSIGKNAFTVPCGTFCFKSENPPSLDISSLKPANEIVVPIGSLKKFLSSSQDWKYLASRTKEKDVLLMHSSLELEAMEKEKKRKEEAERKTEEERQKAEEEKRRREEEKRRKEEEERQKAEEEEYAAQYEAMRRKQMGLCKNEEKDT